jgi:hypothetical protein
VLELEIIGYNIMFYKKLMRLSKARCATAQFIVWFVTGTRALDAQGTNSTLKCGVLSSTLTLYLILIKEKELMIKKIKSKAN